MKMAVIHNGGKFEGEVLTVTSEEEALAYTGSKSYTVREATDAEIAEWAALDAEGYTEEEDDYEPEYEPRGYVLGDNFARGIFGYAVG